MRRFRIVIAAHGDLADAFRRSAEMICGPLEDLATVGLLPEDSPESFRDRLLDAIGDDAGRTRPLLLLTDLTGGTPHNVCAVTARALPECTLVSGVNLPIVIEAATSMDELDEPSVERLIADGRDALDRCRQLVTSRVP